jgi:hypothetical protein
VCVGKAPVLIGFSGWNKPPRYNCVGGMHEHLVHHTRCDYTPLSTNVWSHLVRRSELPLPCVRRPGAWEWDFQVDQAPPLQLRGGRACAFGASYKVWLDPSIPTILEQSGQAFRVAAALCT